MTNILILTASFGMGHKSVSDALKEQIEYQDKSAKIEIADLWDVVNPKAREFGSKMYYSLTENYPLVYNAIYDIKKTKKNNIIDSLLCNVHYKKLYNYLLEKSPNIIISTFPLCSCFVSKIKHEFNLKTNLITVITDVVDSWEWIYEETNLYLVASYEIKDRLIEKGVNKDIVFATGIPVKKDFLNNNPTHSVKNTLLIVASGMNIDDISNDMLKHFSNKKGLKTIVVAGRNEKLYKKLTHSTYNNVEILGFVDNIDKLMDESIFIVTKPGGVTLFEAINKELPLIIKDSGIGQEQGNVEFIKRNNLGIVIKNSNDLLKIVDDYIDNPNKTNYLCNNMRNIKNDLEYDRVADYVLDKVI